VAAEEGRDSDTPLPDPDSLKHDLDYVIRTWMANKLHHTYPRPGGYDDQDEYLMRDWHTMNLYYSRAKAGVYSTVWMDKANPVDWRDSGLMDG